MYRLICPSGTGDIYGNLFRQLAIRGTETWRLAGFKIGNKSNMLGFSGNKYFDSLIIWSCKLEMKSEPSDDFYCNLTFNEVPNSGGVYENNNFIISNLPEGIGSFEAFLVKASGSRSVEDNAMLIKENTQDPTSYVVISSRHSCATSVSFTLEQDGSADIVTFTQDSELMPSILELLKNTVNAFNIEEVRS